MTSWRDVPCKLWSGAKAGKTGYGVRRVPGTRRNSYVHRDAWTAVHGAIPEGVKVCHHCDTPNCYEERHLFLGTQRDNMRDCVAKGRHRHGVRPREAAPRGERHCNAKLTDVRALAVIALLAEGVSACKVAALTGMGKTAIWRIGAGTAWTHLPRPAKCGAKPLWVK